MWFRYAFNKLVRSFVLTKEEEKNKIIMSYKILNKEEYKQELINKFHEEALEVIGAKDKHELIIEIADCYEVIDEILKEYCISKEEILNAQKEKRKERGGFEKAIFINYMQYDSKNAVHQNIHDYVKNKNEPDKYKFIGKAGEHVIDFIITNEIKDKIYIEQNSSNLWQLPRGKIKTTEILSEAVARELKGKFNLDLLKVNEILCDEYVNIDQVKYFYTLIVVELKNANTFIKKEDLAQCKWVSKNEINLLFEKEDENNLTYQAILSFFKNK